MQDMQNCLRTLWGGVVCVGLVACGAGTPNPIPTEPEAPTATPQPTPPSSKPAPDSATTDPCGPIDLKAAKSFKKAQALLQSQQARCGGGGLVAALAGIDQGDPDRAFAQAKLIFTMIRSLRDPGAADSLVVYLDTKPPFHWRTQAALALAEIGDERAVPYLAARLWLNSTKLYGDSKAWEEQALARDDSERVVAARLLADLAALHPDRRPWMLEKAESAVLAWLDELPSPHANGLRFLAAAGSAKAIPRLRAWAFPSVPLPPQGQAPPMPEEWVIPQTALRYLGKAKDESSWTLFESNLNRRRTEAGDADITMEALMKGQRAILGMALRAVGVGVADGFAEWGDPRAYPLLIRYIEDKRENEQARLSACFALAWVTPEDKALEVPRKVAIRVRSKDPREQLIASCYAHSLARRPPAKGMELLIPLLKTDVDPSVRTVLAEAIGRAGLTDSQAASLRSLLTHRDHAVAADASLALLLGGSEIDASAVVPALLAVSEERVETLRENYSRAFGYLSDEDLESGRMDRWARNAQAASAAHPWVLEVLSEAFGQLMFDQGPRSLTRVVLQYRLLEMAKGGDDSQRASATRLLRVIGAEGALMSLRRGAPSISR